MSVKVWLAEIRFNFLALPVILALYGTAIAYYLGNGVVNWGHSALAGIGLIALHIAVNVYNEYSDFKTGIDLETPKTPFSGGSGVLPSGALTPKQVLFAARTALAIGSAIGIYLTIYSGLALLVIGLIGVLFIVGYTPLFTRFMIGEVAAGLGLGTLPVLGVQFLSTYSISLPAIIAALPPGFLVFNLLLLNEFPDAEADARGGRRHLLVVLGKKIGGYIYTAAAIAVYAVIILGVVSGVMPAWTLLGLLTIPAAAIAINGALRLYNAPTEAFLSAQAMNVITTLATQLLLAIAYFLS